MRKLILLFLLCIWLEDYAQHMDTTRVIPVSASNFNAGKLDSNILVFIAGDSGKAS